MSDVVPSNRFEQSSFLSLVAFSNDKTFLDFFILFLLVPLEEETSFLGSVAFAAAVLEFAFVFVVFGAGAVFKG